jgi:pimeloyl-ACP methyl ester carboxylesterase
MSEVERRSTGEVSYLARPGSGPVVVFLHGIGSNATSFAPLFDRLPGDLNLVAWNAPGYLSSAPLAAHWPVADDYAGALERFLVALGHRRVHLVGHSLGTLIATAFARRAPKRLESLTLAAAANGYGVVPGSALSDKTAARLEDLAALGPAAFAHARAGNLVHDPEANPEIVAQVEAAMAQVNPEGYGQAVRMLASGKLAEDIGAVQLRPGFIIGAQDRVTPEVQTRAAARAWQAAHGAAPRVTEIDQAGHAVYLQQPDAFCAALLDHLAQASSRNPEGV